jgi:hypothetical protein
MKQRKDNIQIEEGDIMSPQAAAKFLGLVEEPTEAAMQKALKTLSNWRTLRTGPSFTKLGGKVSYLRQHLQEYILNNVEHCA